MQPKKIERLNKEDA